MTDVIDINTRFGPYPAASTDLTIASLLELMGANGVARAATFSTLGVLFDAAIGNAATRAACGEHPEFVPVAAWHPALAHSGSSGLAAAAQEGFRIIRFFPAEQGWPIEWLPFLEAVEVAASQRLPIMVDIARLGEITVMQRVMPADCGPVVLAGVTGDTLPEAVAALKRREHWRLELSSLLGVGAVAVAADGVGASRLLFGTGAPQHPMATVRNAIAMAGLPDNDVEAVLGGNAARLLNDGTR